MNKKAWTDWIGAVKEHYPDLEMIEVVNEAVKSANNYHSDFARSKFIEALGGDSGNYEFVVTAFKMARERWPKAIKNMWTHGIPTHPLDSLDSIALENSTAVNRKIQGKFTRPAISLSMRNNRAFQIAFKKGGALHSSSRASKRRSDPF